MVANDVSCCNQLILWGLAVHIVLQVGQPEALVGPEGGLAAGFEVVGQEPDVERLAVGWKGNYRRDK